MVSGEMADVARKGARESHVPNARVRETGVPLSLPRAGAEHSARGSKRAMRRGCDTCGPRRSCTNACAMVRARARGHRRHHRDGMGTRVRGKGRADLSSAWK